MIELLKNQLYKASGLNLVVGAIVLWDTVYVVKAVEHLQQIDQHLRQDLVKYLSPLGWEHINLTGDYIRDPKIKVSQLRIN